MTPENKKMNENWQKPLEGGIQDNRAYRQFVASSSKGRADDLAVAFGQMRDTEQMFREERTGLGEKDFKQAPKWIRILRALCFVLALISGYFILMLSGAEGTAMTVLWGFFLVCAVAFVALVVLGIVKRK